MQDRRQYPSYRQWKAWKSLVPRVWERLCFICRRELRSIDGLSTKRVVGGKAAAFGGVGRERIAWNRPEDTISAGCTVKVQKLVREIVTPAHTIHHNGTDYIIPEKSEKEYKSTLMRVSMSGVACEICCAIALLNLDDRYPGTVDISELVLESDPENAPIQEGNNKERTTVRRLLLGARQVCSDNIIRVKESQKEEAVSTIQRREPDDPITTGKKIVKPPKPTQDVRLTRLQDSLLYWTAPRKIAGSQTVSFISDRAYDSAKELAHALRYPLGDLDFSEQPERMYTPVERFK